MGKIASLAALLLAACSNGPQLNNCPCRALDGDTFVNRTGRHIRLARIDAPELPGHCRRGRICVNGDPWIAKDALQTMLDAGVVSCTPQDTDVYGRTIADCRVTNRLGNTLNISDILLESGLVGLYRRPR